MRKASYGLILCSFLWLGACGTTDSQLSSQGRSEAYITGFHDGRHSGIKEAGNQFEHFIKDQQRYDNDAQYRDGWLAGEAEGKRLQAQASAAGNLAAEGYQGYQIQKEVDRRTDPEATANEVLKDVDTDELKVLEED